MKRDALSEPTRVLVVEDDHDTADFLSALLATEQIDSAAAATGEAALQIASAFRPTAVITDFEMPGINGIELMLALKEQQLVPPGAKFICVSGLDEVRSQCLRAGFDLFVIKPVTLHKLAAMLQCIRSHEAERAQ
ncbi:response regulator [Roseateles amylovorans]|uniref:Response regulator n=1 Tax=Roseateles amylovorans TaxID=2978473 RepID=A0ABY6AW51_9BURK|nr:response regulator [Roseateles amylovorans]UXH77401.1 response regulator [Roseateles amylovorans]